MKKFLYSLLLLAATMTTFTLGSSEQSQLFTFPNENVYNVTGALHNFVEQLQENSNESVVVINDEDEDVVPVQLPRQSSVIYGNNPIAYGQPADAQVSFPPSIHPNQNQIPQQPPMLGPPNRPMIDPALQRLLASFNTNPENTRQSYEFGQPQVQPFVLQDAQGALTTTPITVSYVTCYVGCSHVTNITSDAQETIIKPNGMLLFSLLLLPNILLFLIL